MGLWCIRSPAEIVDRSAESEDLGQVVLDAVSLPAQIVPHPKQHEWTEHTREALHPLQRQARVRSWKAFLLPADDVHVHRTESEIRVVPYVQDPSRKHPGTRMPVVEREVLLVRPDARSLGDALFTAFDR